MTIIVDIIDTMLCHTLERSYYLVRERGTHNGCRLAIPNREANKPVKNGSTAEPACPTPEMYPIAPKKSQRGRMWVLWFTRIGNIGPRSRPTNATAIAFSTRDGTTQMVTSSLSTGTCMRNHIAANTDRRSRVRTGWLEEHR